MKKDKIVIEDYPIDSVVSVCTHHNIQNLEGQMLTLLEIALEGRKLEATKSLFRQKFWDWASSLPLHERALIGENLNKR